MSVNREYYSIIHNAADIARFATIFNVEKKHLALCMYLTARQKYYPALTQGAILLNRIVIVGGTNFAQRLYQNILRLESPIGSYTDNDTAIPNSAVAVYAIVEPKDTIKAMAKTLHQCVDKFDTDELPNAYALYRDEITKTSAISSPRYHQIDVDTKDISKIEQVHAILTKLSIPIIICIETRGGFHIVHTDVDKTVRQALYAFRQTTSFRKPNVDGKMMTDYWCSATSQPSIVVPGTYQGNFATRIISLSDWLKEKRSVCDSM